MIMPGDYAAFYKGRTVKRYYGIRKAYPKYFFIYKNIHIYFIYTEKHIRYYYLKSVLYNLLLYLI